MKRPLCLRWFAFFWAVFALLIATWQVMPQDVKPPPEPDYINFYQPVAENLLEGRGLRTAGDQPAVRYPPVYPAFLAMLYFTAGRLHLAREAILVVAALVLHALTTTLLGWFVARFWQGKYAIAAALVWLYYPPALWSLSLFGSECLYIPLFLANVVLFWSAVQGPRLRWWLVLLSGLMAGAAMLTRPLALPLPLVLAAGVCLLARRHPWRPRAAAVATLLLGTLLVAVPWEVWIYVQCDRFHLLSSGGLPSAVDGLTYARQSDSREDIAVPADMRAMMYDLETRSKNGDIQTLGQLGGWMLAQTRAHPLVLARLLGTKVVRCWYATDSHRFESWLVLMQMPFLGLAVAGSIRAWRQGGRQRDVVILALALIAANWLMAAAVLSILRYMLPVMPLVILLMAAVPGGVASEMGPTAHRKPFARPCDLPAGAAADRNRLLVSPWLRTCYRTDLRP